MENEFRNDRDEWRDLRRRNRTNSRYVTGFILILIGAALLIQKMGVPLPYWLFTWPMILIVVGIHNGIKHGFRNSSWIILIAIGGFFLVDDFIPELRLEPLFWPVAIIGLGILFIIKPRRRDFDREWSWDKDGKKPWQTGDSSSGQQPVNDSSDYFKINSVFSGVKRTVLSKNFKGGSISCVFGGVEIDLTQADITEKVEIRLEQVFGGTKLVVPADWVVQNEIDGVFHGVEDKRGYRSGIAANPDKVLFLRGSCVFAGVEVRSY